MAAEDRTPPQHVTFLRDAVERLPKAGLFPVVRGAEARAPHLPLVGTAKRPEHNIVDLAQTPSMGFDDRTLSRIAQKDGRTKLSGYWLGLTGTMGPLPIHLTEFAFYERRYATRSPFTDWLDVLAARMLQLFYRAWADSQPAAMADRPDDDRFARYVSALTGAMEGVSRESAFPAHARSHYAAVFGGSRSAVAIEDALSDLLGQSVTLQEFQSRWNRLTKSDQTTLGRSFATLGGDAVLGSHVRTNTDAFRVVIRASNLRDYRSLLPTGNRFAIAAEALDAFKPSHLEWDILLELEEAKAPAARLDGKAQLGWLSWMKGKGSTAHKANVIRADAHLRKTPRRRERAKT